MLYLCAANLRQIAFESNKDDYLECILSQIVVAYLFRIEYYNPKKCSNSFFQKKYEYGYSKSIKR